MSGESLPGRRSFTGKLLREWEVHEGYHIKAYEELPLRGNCSAVWVVFFAPDDQKFYRAKFQRSLAEGAVDVPRNLNIAEYCNYEGTEVRPQTFVKFVEVYA